MELWGYKTVAMFDVWSIEHFVTGMNMFFLSINWHQLFGRPIPNDKWLPAATLLSLFGWIMVGCYGWESLEHYLETGLAGAKVEYWFQGVEHWSNRLITDPLLILAGSWLAYRHRRLNIPSKIFSLSWVMVHIFLFPHSMYLQQLMPSIAL
jgi:hypothetical protein